MENKDQSAQQNKLTQIYFWGSDNSGLLGPDKKPKTLYLKPQSFNFGVKIDYLACGDEHIVFLSNGYCYSMGENTDGRLGISKNIKATPAPCLIETLMKFDIVKVACGSKHSVAMSDSGQAFVWGSGASGQLGLENYESQGTPQQVFLEKDYRRSRGEASESVIDISCGSEHTAVVTKYGDVYTFGSNQFGQLGSGNNKGQCLPVRVNAPHQNIQKVSCGKHHTLILTAQGHIYGFGLNSSGQLGTGNKQSVSVPTKTLTPENVKIAKITAGYHSLAVSTKGELFIWGECSLGRYVKPHKYAWTSNLEICSAEMGDDFTVGLDDKGYVWGFGNNSSGGLGQGNLESYDSVIPISYLNSIEIKAISCGKSFVVALAEYSTDALSANEVRQIENRQSYDHRTSKTDPDMEYLESSAEDCQIIESNTDSLSERVPSPLRTNPDISGKDSRNYFNISTQKTPPVRTRNQVSNSKEWQESETNLTETDRFVRESPAFSIQNNIIETKHLKEAEKNMMKKDPMRNILVDMKILKLQNALLEQQLEERSRQIAGLQSKLQDTIHKTKKSNQNEQKMKELVLTVEAQCLRFREESIKNSEELKIKDSEIEKLTKAIDEKNLYIDSLEKKNDTSKELIQNLLQIKKLHQYLLPSNSEIDYSLKTKILSQFDNLNIQIATPEVCRTEIAETHRSEILIDLYQKHRFSLDQQLKSNTNTASPQAFSMTNKTQKSPSISKNENYLQSSLSHRKKGGTDSKNSVSHEKELSVPIEALPHAKLGIHVPQMNTPANKESRTADIYPKPQSSFNFNGFLSSRLERGVTEPDQKTIASAKTNKRDVNEFVHQKKFSEPSLDSKILSNYANEGKSHRAIINNYFKGPQGTQEKVIHTPKDSKTSMPTYISNQSNPSPKIQSAYTPLTSVRDANKDRKKSQPSQFYTKLIGMISSPAKTNSTNEKTRVSTARQAYYK